MIVYLDNIRGSVIESIMSRYLKNPHCMVCFHKMNGIGFVLPNTRLPVCGKECYDFITKKGDKK